MRYYCCDEGRRKLLRRQTGENKLNGIEYLEVLDSAELPDEQRQRKLYVHFTSRFDEAPGPKSLTKSNVKIEGGERVRDIVATAVEFDSDVVTVTVNKPGDFSRYTLRLVTDSSNSAPPAGIDPILSWVEFSFKVNCPSDFDCKSAMVCPSLAATQPQIDYLTKDYASFRRLMLDRLALLLPGWQESHAADLGIALVEILAYVGDQLSYCQDAIATEAYLGTARRRVSIRRHARLVDYRMHDGCNARAWVQVQVSKPVLLRRVEEDAIDGKPVLRTVQFFTRVTGMPTLVKPGSQEERRAGASAREIFEPMQDAILYPQHNEMRFYTWGDDRCCLPKGATSATLMDLSTGDNPRLLLHRGDVLVFEERLGPRAGLSGDADPTHRHAVRLTSVNPEALVGADGHTRLAGPAVLDPLTGTPVVEISWAEVDALPFPLCISSQTDEEHGSRLITDVSVARGNIVLVDHGMTVRDEDIGTVPQALIRRPASSDADPCSTPVSMSIPPRFRPQLKKKPLTFAAPPPDLMTPARVVVQLSPAKALPSVVLTSTSTAGLTRSWEPVQDLLDSRPDSTHFVVETESDGTSFIRFGDDRNGLRPNSETSFKADYRVGNGSAGNVGADAIVHVVSNQAAITLVRNPIPASGGTEPESIERARQSAPFAFRVQERAVTPEDYAEVAQRYAGVQRAAATFRWTGSWHTVFLTIDRLGGKSVDAEFRQEMVEHLEKYRMAGYDVEIDEPRYVSLEIGMDVCVKPDYFRSDVEQVLRARFSNQLLPCGRRGFFHPDNFTFNQNVYLSKLYAEAQAVDGVSWVRVTMFREQGRPETCALDSGVLKIGRLEVARLDSDPNHPDHGKLVLNMIGGK